MSEPLPFSPSGNKGKTSSMAFRAINGLLLATIFWSISFPLVQVLYAGQRLTSPQASPLFLSTLLMTTRFALAALVVGVPEPSVWGMLIAGFGLVGFQARRRRHTATVAA